MSLCPDIGCINEFRLPTLAHIFATTCVSAYREIPCCDSCKLLTCTFLIQSLTEMTDIFHTYASFHHPIELNLKEVIDSTMRHLQAKRKTNLSVF